MLGTNSGCRLTHDSCGFRDAAAHLRHFRQSEIQNLNVPTLGHKDIGRLDVAVDNAFCVRSVQSIGNLDSERQHHLDVQWFAGDPVLQCHAVQKLHGNESLTIFLTDVVNRANILMIQSRRRLRLALEAGQCLRVSGDFFGQKLESNEAMQPRVLGFIHHTHTAAPELLDDAVVRDGLADQLGWFHPMVGMLGMLIDASQGSRTVGFDGAISDLATSWTSWAGLDSAFRGW